MEPRIPCSPFRAFLQAWEGRLSVPCCAALTVALTTSVFQILIPPKGLFTKLKKEAENPREVLDQVNSVSYNQLCIMSANYTVWILFHTCK